MGKHRGLRGQIFDGRYRVDSLIGSGGMAVVWSATQLRTGQRVALKVMLDLEACTQQQVRRLLREAQATSAIQSRHVVRIVDVHPDYRHEGLLMPFVAMELLEGINLAQYVSCNGPIAPSNFLWLMAQIGQGLSSAHTKGIVHRDLKPANVFIAEEDERSCVVKLCDFGIAKVERDRLLDPSLDESQLTETGALMGTPRYMAPEQLRHTGRQGPATDQWAVALVAYAALTGRSYFESARNGAELVLAISQDRLTSPSELCSDFPHALDGWFMRSCAREPEQRFESVDAQYLALAQALDPLVPEPLTIDSLRHAKRSCIVDPTANPLSQEPPSQVTQERVSAVPRWRNVSLAWLLGIATALTAAGLYVLPRVISPRLRAPARSVATASVETVLSRTVAERQNEIPPTAPIPQPSEIPPVGRKLTVVPASTRVPAPHRRIATANQPEVRVNLLPAGASCIRSAQCASKLCLAELCQ